MTWALQWCSFNCCDIDRRWGLIVDEVCLVSVSTLLSGCCSSPAALLFFEAHFLSFLSSPSSPHRHYHSQCSYWYVSAEGRRLQRQGLESKKPQTAAHGAPGNLRLNQPTDLTGTAETHWFWFFCSPLSLSLSDSTTRRRWCWWEGSSWSVNDKGGSRH